ncbi:hypothetical protein I6M42_12540 [Shewanella algae]|uniref:hypothetical protein n=1 Tax=Shewanella algae TaxID=38313 RepID=UPI001AAE53EA|nr:hypothetical protein [Shewanella algae]MBO2637475.1 hypothetical protein [Shewanella algae]
MLTINRALMVVNLLLAIYMIFVYKAVASDHDHKLKKWLLSNEQYEHHMLEDKLWEITRCNTDSQCVQVDIPCYFGIKMFNKEIMDNGIMNEVASFKESYPIQGCKYKHRPMKGVCINNQCQGILR